MNPNHERRRLQEVEVDVDVDAAFRGVVAARRRVWADGTVRTWMAVAALCLPMVMASCASMPGYESVVVAPPASDAGASTESAAGATPSASDAAAPPEPVAPPEPIQPSLPPPAYFHFLRGYMAELANDVPTATAEYRAALNVNPSSIFLRVRLAALRFVSGAMGQAVSMLDQIALDQVGDVTTFIQMAKIYAGAGQPERALGLYKEAIRFNPAHSDPYFEQGALLLTLNRHALADEAFTRGIARAPKSPLGYFYRGKVMEAQGNNAEAKEAYRQSLVRGERFEPALQALIALYEADGNVEDAVRLYERLIVDDHLRGHKFRDNFVRLLVREKQYARALEVLAHVLADDPGNVNAHIRQAMVYTEMQDHPRAIADLTRLVREYPSELRVRDYLGWVYEQVEKFDDAVNAYRANIERDAAFYDSRVHLGFLLYRLRRFDEAATHLIQAAALNPDHAATHLLLGLSYVRTEQFERARAAFEAGLAHHPDDKELRFNLGAAYDKLNRFSDVVREMEAVLARDPNHTDALNYLGYSYADRGIHGEEAVALTQRAVTLKPDNGSYVDSLGWALFKVGRVDDALRAIKRAAELVNDDPVIFEHLGEIYLTQDHPDEAQAAWRRSLTLDPKNERLIKRFREVGFGNPQI